MDMTGILVGVAWLAIGAAIAAAIADGVRKTWSSDAPLPFFREMELRGLTPARLEAAVGMAQLAGAVRRCALCRERVQCARRGAAARCPNEHLLRRAAR